MASNYNSLGFNLMTTGENAGTWGTNTNLNLNYLRDTFGYITVAMTADRTLTIPDNSTGTYDGRAFIIECNGALGANRVLDIAATAGSGSSPGGSAAIYKPFIVFNNTSTSYTLTFKVTGQTGFVLTQGSTYLCYHNGTDIINTGLLSGVVVDTSPQLGGNLDCNGNDIVSTSNADIDIIPNGTGDVNLGADTVQVGDNDADATITTQGTGDLILNTNNGTNAGNITLADGANGNIDLTTNGTGAIKFNDMAYIPQQALTSTSNAVAWDAQAKSNAYHLTTENTTIAAPTNPVEGAFICLEINHDGTTTVGWNAIFNFAADTEPTTTDTNGTTDIFVFRYNGAIWQEVGRTLNLQES
jgi:hypothetical protein